MNEPSLTAPSDGSVRLLNKLLLDIRRKAREDAQLRDRLRLILKMAGERERFTHWLKLHQRYALGDGEKTALLESLITSLSSPSDLELDTLISQGLGLVFIRYNPATQESYYHYLRCDLLADSIRNWVAAVLSVPRDQGSIGGVVGWARQWHHIARRRTAPSPFGLSLYSCFLDPRGRVATEDLAIGNRAWIATPVFSDAGLLPAAEYGVQDPTRDDPLGVLFVFFPIDGMFHCETRKEATALPFVNSTLSLFGQYAPTLAYHLTLEAFAVRTRLARSAAIGFSTDSTGTRTTTALEQISASALAELVPNSGPADDAAGFLLAITDEQSDASYVQSRARDRTFFGRLFQLIQLACLYPREWLPGAAEALMGLSRAHEPKDPWQPIWLGQDSEGIGQFWQLYPEGALAAGRRASRTETPRAPKSSLHKSFLGELYRDTLELYGSGRQVADLAVPLMPDLTNVSGYIRINCRVISLDSSASRAHQSLYSWVTGNLYGVSKSLAMILGHLHETLNIQFDERRGVELGTFKSLVDFRFVVCQLTAIRLAHCFSPDPSQARDHPGHLREIVIFSSRILDSVLPGLSSLLESLLEQLDKLEAPVVPMPPVLLVSIWSTAKQFVMTSHEVRGEQGEAPSLDQILLSDSGLPQMISYLVSYVGGRRGGDIKISSDGLYKHRLAEDPIVLPVIPDTLDKDRAEFLELWVRRSGKADRVSSRISSPSQWTIDIQWELNASPMPVAYALCPGTVSIAAFADISIPIDDQDTQTVRSDRLVFSKLEDLTKLPESLRSIGKLGGIFRSTRASSAYVVRLEILPFPEVPKEDLGPFGTPSVPRSRPRHLALLTLALGPEPEWLWTLRDVALRNALRTAEQAMQSVQAELWRTLQAIVQFQRESMRALRHQLSHDLASFRDTTVSAAAHIPPLDYSAFRAQAQHFHLLVEYLADGSFHSPLKADVGDIVEQAIAFLGRTKRFSIGQNLPDQTSMGLHLLTEDRNVSSLYIFFFNLIKNAAKSAARHPNRPGEVRITYPEVNTKFIEVQIANSGAMEQHYLDFLCGELELHPDRARQPEDRMKGLEVARYIAKSFGIDTSIAAVSAEDGRCVACLTEGSTCHGTTVLKFRVPRRLSSKRRHII